MSPVFMKEVNQIQIEQSPSIPHNPPETQQPELNRDDSYKNDTISLTKQEGGENEKSHDAGEQEDTLEDDEDPNLNPYLLNSPLAGVKEAPLTNTNLEVVHTHTPNYPIDPKDFGSSENENSAVLQQVHSPKKLNGVPSSSKYKDLGEAIKYF